VPAVKHRYQIDLANPTTVLAGEDVTVRTITAADLPSLAGLMLEAYRGTIDYEDETYEDAVAEVESLLNGRPMLDHSYLATVEGTAASAVLVTTSRGEPFIAWRDDAPGVQEPGYRAASGHVGRLQPRPRRIRPCRPLHHRGEPPVRSPLPSGRSPGG